MEAGNPWKIKKVSWSAADEKAFENFIAQIGQMVAARKCHSVNQCLKSSANIYRKSDPASYTHTADCAKFPYYLRTYFAWKNNLPFSYASDMTPWKVPGNTSSDIRYSRYGNEVAARRDLISQNNNFPDALKVLQSDLSSDVSSANFRTHYSLDDARLFTDFYADDLNRITIKPGTTIYDPNGHVAIVYEVTTDGRVLYMDAHPDNSLTSGFFGKKFIRSHPGQGAGFKNWRPTFLVDASQDSEGNFVGGKIMPTRNKDLPDLSVVQYFGLYPEKIKNWTEAIYELNGKKVEYYDFVRARLSVGEMRIRPVQEFLASVKQICVDAQDRVMSVEDARKSNVDRKSHPERLPENIYGTSGEWETYSTPSRDARLKVVFRDLLEQSEKYFKLISEHDPILVYQGKNLAADLLQTYQEISAACTVQYTKSDGSQKTLNLENIRQRLFKLSFDPYHCAELRWGAADAQELASCKDSEEKRQWFANEQYLRNQIERKYDDKTNFNLEELKTPRPGNGVLVAPDVDIAAFLKANGAN